MNQLFTTDPIDKYLAIAENVRIILDKAEAIGFLLSLDEAPTALDFETTSLYPAIGQVRLSCIYSPKTGPVVLDHFFCGSFEELVGNMLRPEWLVYNKKFEWSWFKHFGHGHDTLITDVDFMAKAKLGGYPSSFARMCKRDLKIDLDKTLQTSDWSTLELSDQQYTYGCLDAILTYELFTYWDGELTDDQFGSIDYFNNSVPCVVECEQTGLVLDIDTHVQNIKKWKMKQENALRYLRKHVPKSALDNLNSNAQVSKFIRSQLTPASLSAWPVTGKQGYLSLTRQTVGPIAAKAPYPFNRWLNAFMLYRYYSKYTSTYGDKLVNIQHMNGKITSRFNIGQAATGRFSSSNTNLQNIPRKKYIRKAFYAKPDSGLVMVGADYSGIEVRVLAEISGDKGLLNDTIYGDVHSTAASRINRIDIDEFLGVIGNENDPHYYAFSEMRSRAKGFTFQLLYGAGNAALSVPLRCSEDEAGNAVREWAALYPNAYHYRDKMFDVMSRTGFIPIVTGRTVYVRKVDRTMPVAANYPVQGAAGDVMLAAMHHTYEAKRFVLPKSVKVAATVHDELLMYATEAVGDTAKELLEVSMTKGWLDVFPGSNTDNLLESRVGMNWAGVH